jgi:cell division transport system permease protein
MNVRDTRRRARAWGRRQLYSFFSSLGTLLGHRLGTLMTVLALGIAMLLPLGLYVALDNLRGLDLRQEDWGTITVFLRPEVTAEQAAEFAGRIGQERGAEVVTVSPEQGMAEFAQSSGFGQTLDLFEENPLPWVLLVTPRMAEGQNIEAAVGDLGEWLGQHASVDLVQADFKWLQRLAGLLALGDAFVTVLTVLFALAVVVVVANTIRLDVASRAHEIEVLLMVGAGNGFIRQPFLYLGFWYGLLGALLALLLLSLCLLYLSRPLGRLLEAYGSSIILGGPGAASVSLVLVCGGLLGLLGAWVAVQRYLRLFRLPESGASA